MPLPIPMQYISTTIAARYESDDHSIVTIAFRHPPRALIKVVTVHNPPSPVSSPVGITVGLTITHE